MTIIVSQSEILRFCLSAWFRGSEYVNNYDLSDSINSFFEPILESVRVDLIRVWSANQIPIRVNAISEND